MNDRPKDDAKRGKTMGNERPIHSKSDIHDAEEGMPLALAGGGYGGSARTAKTPRKENGGKKPLR